MVENIEYRYELKYVISPAIAMLLKKQLGALMQKDVHSIGDDYSYLIRSLYFDDVNSTAYYEKNDGVEYRSKYRLRMYNFDESFIRLENKHKEENMTYKEDCKVSKDVAKALIAGRYDLIITKNAFLQRFISDALTHRLVPSVIVDYKRLAYTYPTSEVRITFDEELRSGRYNLDFFDKNIETTDMYRGNGVILEVKCNEFIPEHILNILNSVPMIRQAFSKFAACRSIK